jgi:hypothetical protein
LLCLIDWTSLCASSQIRVPFSFDSSLSLMDWSRLCTSLTPLESSLWLTSNQTLAGICKFQQN